LNITDFDYHLPAERIAQTPVEPRHAARLLVLDRTRADLDHTVFWEIDRYLRPNDMLVINQTRVIPARLFAHKPTGGKVEILLLRQVEPRLWEALVGGKKMLTGQVVKIDHGPEVVVEEVLEGSHRLVRFTSPIEPFLPNVGQMPLPPYIHTPLQNPERYQTVYAQQTGSAAAPTAGLHFTPELMKKLEDKGIQFARVTLHVGLDTFAPVTEEVVEEHKIHTEWCEVTPSAAEVINQTHTRGGRVIAVGTTSVRTLESAAQLAATGQLVAPISGPTSLYILPGYQFKAVDGMVTNFHLPKSTLIMLVSAFAGRERVLAAYEEAIRREYRFYSFGDAMLIL
jgi:S-adenosylmethionine:tRNA ribosyltransferase-isomerase